MDTWESVRTAPRDGTRVLLRRKGWVEDVCVGYWQSDYDSWFPVGSNIPWVDVSEWREIPT